MTIPSHPRLVSRRCHQILAGLPSASFPRGIFPIGTGRGITSDIPDQLPRQIYAIFRSKSLFRRLINLARKASRKFSWLPTPATAAS